MSIGGAACWDSGNGGSWCWCWFDAAGEVNSNDVESALPTLALADDDDVVDEEVSKFSMEKLDFLLLLVVAVVEEKLLLLVLFV